MRSDFIMAESLEDLSFNAETQRSLRVNSIKTISETAIGLISTFQKFVQPYTYRTDYYICRYLPANITSFSLRSLGLCGDQSLFSTHGIVSEPCCTISGTVKTDQRLI